jgi:hypothetical protein
MSHVDRQEGNAQDIGSAVPFNDHRSNLSEVVEITAPPDVRKVGELHKVEDREIFCESYEH